MQDSQLQTEREHLRALLELTNAVTTRDVASLTAAIAEQTGWVIGGAGGAAARLGLKRTSLVSTMRRLAIVRPKPHAGANRDLRAR